MKIEALNDSTEVRGQRNNAWRDNFIDQNLPKVEFRAREKFQNDSMPVVILDIIISSNRLLLRCEIFWIV